MLGELIVVVNVALGANGSAGEFALVPDVFDAREPFGEYLLYVSADKAAQGADGRINANDAALLFEVAVSYETDTLAVARSEIEALATADGDSYELTRGLIEGLGAQQVLELFKAPQVRLPIEHGADYGSFVEFSDGWGRKQPYMTFRYFRFSDERTLEISALCRRADCTTGEVYSAWQALVERYRDMPPIRFTGAERE